MDPLARFRAWFAHEGRSQAEIAARLGCSQMTVSRLLRGSVPRGLELALAIERESAVWDRGPIRASEWVHESEPTERTGTDD